MASVPECTSKGTGRQDTPPTPRPFTHTHASEWTWALPNLRTIGEGADEGSAVWRTWVWAPVPHRQLGGVGKSFDPSEPQLTHP